MARDLAIAARRKLIAIDAAERLHDLRIPPGNRLEALRGDRAGQHSIRINGQCRVVFVWRGDGAHEVGVEDYHERLTGKGRQDMAKRPVISREDLDAGRVDLSDMESAGRLPPVHPGDVLRHDFLGPLGLSAHALALALRVPPNRITTILAGDRAVTAETALRLARHFGTSPGFWLNLQKAYELEVVERAKGERIRAEVTPRVAA
jgi:addiction module HigA family antidote